MDTGKMGPVHSKIPHGFQAVPIHSATKDSPLRLCVLVRESPDAVGGPFVVLRETIDARIYLGCVTDAAGEVREWIELWVQDSSTLESTPSQHRQTLTNHLLDERWRQYHRSWCELDSDSVIHTGWESVNPPPTFVDLKSSSVRSPVDPHTDQAWQLCRDDASLQAAGLPPYSTSLSRHLYVDEPGRARRFIPASQGATDAQMPEPLAQALGSGDRLVAFNPHAGFLMARSFYPLSGEEFIDVLGGRPWSGGVIGSIKFDLGSQYTPLLDSNPLQSTQPLLFLGAHGKAGRFVEIFHLKVRLVLETLKLVRSYVQTSQLPLLNIAPDSFRFRLGDVGAGLPWLWTAKGTLVKPGEAIAVSMPLAQERWFMHAGEARASIFQPEGLSAPVRGVGSIRIRKVLSDESEGVSIEGTLDTEDSTRSEQLYLSPNDLLWIRLPLNRERVDLYGHVDAGENLAYGEARFHTLPQKLRDSATSALKASGRVSFHHVPYEVLPLLSSPFDLYALGVLAVRTLLVNEETPLSVALDEVLSLARQIKVDHRQNAPICDRIKLIFDRDERWFPSLGPHHLLMESWSPKEALRLVSPEIWFNTLGAIIAMFPGRSSDSVCRDFGDVAEQALETVFDPSIEQWENLFLQSRSLLFADWTWTREVAEVIDSLVAQSETAESRT